MNSDPHRLVHLIGAHIADTITPEEHAELQHCLRADESARRLWFAHQDLDDGLHDLVRSSAVSPSLKAKRERWPAWRPLTAAAAGLVIGLFSASLVLAYVGPSRGKVVTLLNESFESGPAPLVTGVPLQAGGWSGDYSEVVGAQQEVKPESGRKMLRFLRADYEGKAEPEGSYVADVYQLIDLRSYRGEFADGGAVAQLSAGLNAFAFPEGEQYVGSLSLTALDTEMALNGSTRTAQTLDSDYLAMTSGGRLRLDRDPATWQQMKSELRLPQNTDFILIHIGVARGPKSQMNPTFAGHFLDDVRVTLVRRSPLP